MPKISTVIIAHNEEERIVRCLESLRLFSDEIVVVDSLSDDHTAQLCRDSGCRVLQREFDGYGTQKQFAADQASNHWVLSVDADEVISTGLQEELAEFRKMEEPPVNGYIIPFSLYYMGKILKYSGVGRETHLRLFDRRKGRFTNVPVHEGVEIEGEAGRMKNRIIHYSFRDLSHHLEKINIYTSQAAEKLFIQKKSCSKPMVLLKFPITFFTYFIIKGGILDGYPGFLWSYMAAVYTSMKLAKTTELKRKP